METVEIDIVIVIDDEGNFTVEAADDDNETATRHVDEHGVVANMVTHHLILTVPITAATTQKAAIAAGGPTELKLFKK